MIGIFDSGIGGLFLLKKLHKKFPKQSFVYLADKAHFPYGEKSFSFIRDLVKKNMEFLVAQGAKRIVVACNTASITLEKENFYSIPVMGVAEASLRQAKKDSRNKKVGLLATEGTVRSRAFLKKEKDLSLDLQIYQQTCPELASFVENGGWKISQGKYIGDNKDKSERLSVLLEEYLQPLMDKGVDTVIMGCTHYLYLESAISRYIGKNKKVVGPFEFLVQDLLEVKRKESQEPEAEEIKINVFVSGQDKGFEKQFYQIWGGDKNNVRTVVEQLKI